MVMVMVNVELPRGSPIRTNFNIEHSTFALKTPDRANHDADRKFTTVDAAYAPHVRQSKTSDDDMKHECVQ